MVKLIICSLLSRLQANLKTSHEFITFFFLLLRFKRIFFFNSIDQNYHQINLPRRLPPLLPTAIVGSNSNRRASVACEQAFGRAGNWGKGKAFPFAIFFPKKNREPVHRLRVCDSTCNVWSWLSSDWILLRRRENIPRKGWLQGLIWEMKAPSNRLLSDSERWIRLQFVKRTVLE